MPSIGKRIRKLRKSKGYTQDYLSELVDVSPLTIKQWEHDKKKPGSDNEYKLSKIFGVSMNYIHGGDLPDE